MQLRLLSINLCSLLLQYIKFKLRSLRLIAGREAEEAKRLEAAMAAHTGFQELEEPVTQFASPSKEEAPTVAPPVTTVPARKKKKKKRIF